ncbi:MAG TPA: phosphoglycerate kinase [Thermoanaerobaculia bacterium]|nr:phosphoglycerate kinase [Thermoanaerobaculia bacterium]
MRDIYQLEDLGLDRLRGVAVFVRVDFNVPLADGRVADATRIEAAIPSLNVLRQAGARLVLASHLGRPKGKPDKALSLEPVAEKLGEILGQSVAFAPDSIGAPARAVVAQLGPGGICLLENLRFHAGEKANDPDFAAALADLAEAYVDDAFGTAHRAHASVVGVPEKLSRKAAGRLLMGEISALSRLVDDPARPFFAVLGGAKISDKAATLSHLLGRLDKVFLGGGMANTLLAAQGLELADSLVERDSLELAREILAHASERGCELVLPTDLVVTDDLDHPQRIETVSVDAVPAGTKAVDVGPASIRAITAALPAAATLFWNGPLGVFEKPPFDKATVAVAAAVAAAPGYSVIGGGETLAAADRAGARESIDHVSTGGGASLEFLAGETLPGIAALERG